MNKRSQTVEPLEIQLPEAGDSSFFSQKTWHHRKSSPGNWPLFLLLSKYLPTLWGNYKAGLFYPIPWDLNLS